MFVEHDPSIEGRVLAQNHAAVGEAVARKSLLREYEFSVPCSRLLMPTGALTDFLSLMEKSLQAAVSIFAGSLSAPDLPMRVVADCQLDQLIIVGCARRDAS